VFDRIGIHVGEVWIEEHEGPGKARDLYGLQVDTCARVQSLGQADQILLSRFPFDSARQALKGEELHGIEALSWLNHGPYRLKGVEEPLEICEVGEEDKARLRQPPDSEKAHRFNSADREPVLGWRPAIDQVVPGTGWVLEEKLGEGGFGEVWLGREKGLQTERVFKFCFRADRVRSLKREATLFRLLKERVGEHPNIVAIESVYFDEPPPYYILMQHVAGRDLPSWCASQGGIEKVPLETRLEIVAQIADALQAAHDNGIIHRDVKPSNILVGNQSKNPIHAYLTDFGIGQIISDEIRRQLSVSGYSQADPESASLSGTQLYMAPELFWGKSASIRSDIYALGVVLYQLAAACQNGKIYVWPDLLDSLKAGDLRPSKKSKSRWECRRPCPRRRLGSRECHARYRRRGWQTPHLGWANPVGPSTSERERYLESCLVAGWAARLRQLGPLYFCLEN
jgi:serine/threonine protein kinase